VELDPALRPSARRACPGVRLAVYGGSFDPVHAGHLHVAAAVLDSGQFDRLVLIPAARPPHKPDQTLASGAHRLAMLCAAVGTDARISVSDIELKRAGPSYTVRTLRELPEVLGLPWDVPLGLVVGADNVPDLPRWWRSSELLQRARLCVVRRPGEEEALAQALASAAPEWRVRIERGLLSVPLHPGRASTIRSALTRGEGSPHLPAAVAAYIEDHGLYGFRA